MEERSGHLTVVIGASALAENLRRSLVAQGVAHVGVSSQLRGLRRSIALGENELVVVCIALDPATIGRHGSSLRQLLADQNCFPKAVRSVGLLSGLGLTRDAAELGCDVYVHDSKSARQAVTQLTHRWEQQQTAQQPVEAPQAKVDTPTTWSWGATELPIDLVQMVCGRRLAERQNAHGPTIDPSDGLS